MKRARGNKSARWLSDETAALGYRVSPTVIAKLDSGHRGSVLGVAELLVLAAALEIPPIALLFPDLPDGEVWLLPETSTSSETAMRWFSGEALPGEVLTGTGSGDGATPHQGAQLVEAVRERIEARRRWGRLVQEAPAHDAKADPDARMTAKLFEREIHYAQQRINQLNSRIRDLGGSVAREVAADE